jgi:hypothetical protein
MECKEIVLGRFTHNKKSARNKLNVVGVQEVSLDKGGIVK